MKVREINPVSFIAGKLCWRVQVLLQCFRSHLEESGRINATPDFYATGKKCSINCAFMLSQGQNQTEKGTRKLSYMLDVTSLFNYFLIKFACFDNIYYYKLMFQMEINANSPLHIHLNRLIKFISSCLQNILIYCTQSSIYKSLCQGCINPQSPINSLLLLTAKKHASCRNKSQPVSIKLKMLPTQIC